MKIAESRVPQYKVIPIRGRGAIKKKRQTLWNRVVQWWHKEATIASSLQRILGFGGEEEGDDLPLTNGNLISGVFWIVVTLASVWALVSVVIIIGSEAPPH